MIIDLTRTRETYFGQWTAPEVLAHTLGKRKVTIKEIAGLKEAGKVVVGAAGGDLEELLKGESTADHRALVSKLRRLQPDQLLLLPFDYRIPKREAQRVAAHDTKAFLNLDSTIIQEAVLGEKLEAGPLSVIQKEINRWYPERVLSAALGHLRDKGDRYLEHTVLGYRWKGKDERTHFVPFMNAIEGAELRVFQNYAYQAIGVEIIRREIQTGQRDNDGAELSKKQLEIRKKKLKKIEAYIARNDLKGYLKEFEARREDFIEQLGRPFDHGTGFVMVVPSRSDTSKVYKFRLLNVPVTRQRDPQACSIAWEVEDTAEPEERSFRSDRRKQSRGRGYSEVVHTPHGIAAYHTLRKIYSARETGRKIWVSPFVVPTPQMMADVDKLRYQTLLVRRDGGRTEKRSLNETEIGRIIGLEVMVRGYKPCFSTIPSGDPQLYVARFKTA